MTKEPPEPLRGQVWFVRLGDLGEKPLVVVSNNTRNRALPTVLATRITTAPKPDIPTIVRLASREPMRGSVLCDDIMVVPKQRLRRSAGALSSGTMSRVDEGLRGALALD